MCYNKLGGNKSWVKEYNSGRQTDCVRFMTSQDTLNTILTCGR